MPKNRSPYRSGNDFRVLIFVRCVVSRLQYFHQYNFQLLNFSFLPLQLGLL